MPQLSSRALSALFTVSLAGTLAHTIGCQCDGRTAGSGIDAIDLDTSTVMVEPEELPADDVSEATIRVQLLDSGKKPVSDVALQITATGEGNSISGAERTDAQGNLAATLRSSVAGTKAITVRVKKSGDDLTAHPTVSFTAGATAAARLAFAPQPRARELAGEPWAAFGVQLETADGAPVSDVDATVKVELVSGTGILGTGILDDMRQRTTVEGRVLFPDLSYDKAEPITIRVVDVAGVLLSTTEQQIEVLAGTVRSLRFAQEPTNALAGEAFAPVVVVEILDGFGNVASASTLRVKLLPVVGQAFVLTGDPWIAAVSGRASFADLAVSTAGRDFSLYAKVPEVDGVASQPFDIIAGNATQMAVIAPTSSQEARAACLPVVIEARDALGNPANVDGVAVTGELTAPDGTTSVAHATGANTTFVLEGLSCRVAGVSRLAVSSDGPLTPIANHHVSVHAGAAVRLLFASDVTHADAGVPFGATVRAVDAFDNTDPSFTGAIAFSASGRAGLPAITPLPRGETLDIALTLYERDHNTVRASVFAPPSIEGSFGIDVSPGAPFRLAFAMHPAGMQAYVATVVVVDVQDEYGNLADDSTDYLVTLSAQGGPGALTGTTSGTTSYGRVGISGLRIDRVGTYTLLASALGLLDGVSREFSVSPGVERHLVFVAPPVRDELPSTEQLPSDEEVEASPWEPFAVALVDFIEAGSPRSLGNVVPLQDMVTCSADLGDLDGRPAELRGAAGVAVFANVSYAGRGHLTLSCRSGILAPIEHELDIVEARFQLSAPGPGSVHAGDLFALTITVLDNQNAPATDYTRDSAKEIQLDSDDDHARVAGVFVDQIMPQGRTELIVPDLFFATEGTERRIQVRGLDPRTPVHAILVDVAPAAAWGIAFDQCPSGGVRGQPLSPAPVVSVRDEFGNQVLPAGEYNLSLDLVGRSGALTGITTAAAVTTTATFVDVRAGLVACDLYMTATATPGDWTTTCDTPFCVESSGFHHLEVLGMPSTTQHAGTPFAFELVLHDEAGVWTAPADVNITMTIRRGSEPATNETVTTRSTRRVDQTLFTAGRYTFAFVIDIDEFRYPHTQTYVVDVDPAAPAVIDFSRGQPLGGPAGTSIGNIVMRVEDSYDNPISAHATDVCVGLRNLDGTLPAAVLSGTTLCPTPAAALATLTDLTVNVPGTYRLHATSGSAEGDSAQFTVRPPDNVVLRFDETNHPLDVDPSNGGVGMVIAGDPWTFQVVIRNGDEVGVPLDHSFSISALGLSGVRSDLAGVLTFSVPADRTTRAGFLDFVVQSDTDTTLTLDGEIEVVAGPPASIVFSTNPKDAGIDEDVTAEVWVKDEYGNPVAGAGVTFQVRPEVIPSRPETTDALGYARTTFTLGTPGAYGLDASVAPVAVPASASFTIRAAAPTQIIVEPQPSCGVAGEPMTITARLADALGNIVPIDGRELVLNISLRILVPGLSDLRNLSSDGVTTFSVSVATATNPAGPEHIIIISSAELSAGSSLCVNPAPADHLRVTGIPALPDDYLVGTPVNVTVEAFDAFDNLDRLFEGRSATFVADSPDPTDIPSILPDAGLPACTFVAGRCTVTNVQLLGFGVREVAVRAPSRAAAGGDVTELVPVNVICGQDTLPQLRTPAACIREVDLSTCTPPTSGDIVRVSPAGAPDFASIGAALAGRGTLDRSLTVLVSGNPGASPRIHQEHLDITNSVVLPSEAAPLTIMASCNTDLTRSNVLLRGSIRLRGVSDVTIDGIHVETSAPVDDRRPWATRPPEVTDRYHGIWIENRGDLIPARITLRDVVVTMNAQTGCNPVDYCALVLWPAASCSVRNHAISLYADEPGAGSQFVFERIGINGTFGVSSDGIHAEQNTGGAVFDQIEIVESSFCDLRGAFERSTSWIDFKGSDAIQISLGQDHLVESSYFNSVGGSAVEIEAAQGRILHNVIREAHSCKYRAEREDTNGALYFHKRPTSLLSSLVLNNVVLDGVGGIRSEDQAGIRIVSNYFRNTFGNTIYVDESNSSGAGGSILFNTVSGVSRYLRPDGTRGAGHAVKLKSVTATVEGNVFSDIAAEVIDHDLEVGDSPSIFGINLAPSTVTFCAGNSCGSSHIRSGNILLDPVTGILAPGSDGLAAFSGTFPPEIADWSGSPECENQDNGVSHNLGRHQPSCLPLTTRQAGWPLAAKACHVNSSPELCVELTNACHDTHKACQDALVGGALVSSWVEPPYERVLRGVYDPNAENACGLPFSCCNGFDNNCDGVVDDGCP